MKNFQAQRRRRRTVTILCLTILVSLSLLCLETSGQDARQAPKAPSPANSSAIQAKNSTKPVAPKKPAKLRKTQTPLKTSNVTSSPCEADLSMPVEKCSEPFMGIIEGRIEKWPRNEADSYEQCELFAKSEKCIKDLARRCAKGIQKSIFSTFANSVARARKQECVKERIPGVLAMTKCVEKNQASIHMIMANVTSRLAYIRNNIPEPSQRIVGMCCMVHGTEHSIKELLGPKCAEETKTIIRLYRAVLEDVMELICREQRPCPELFVRYVQPKVLKYEGGLISNTVRLLTDLDQ